MLLDHSVATSQKMVQSAGQYRGEGDKRREAVIIVKTSSVA